MLTIAYATFLRRTEFVHLSASNRKGISLSRSMDACTSSTRPSAAQLQTHQLSSSSYCARAGIASPDIFISTLARVAIPHTTTKRTSGSLSFIVSSRERTAFSISPGVACAMLTIAYAISLRTTESVHLSASNRKGISLYRSMDVCTSLTRPSAAQ